MPLEPEAISRTIFIFDQLLSPPLMGPPRTFKARWGWRGRWRGISATRLLQSLEREWPTCAGENYPGQVINYVFSDARHPGSSSAIVKQVGNRVRSTG